MSPAPNDDLAADTLVGTAAIAAFLGKTERQTGHLLDRKQLPAFKLGRRWHMRKSTYLAHVEKLESPLDPILRQIQDRLADPDSIVRQIQDRLADPHGAAAAVRGLIKTLTDQV